MIAPAILEPKLIIQKLWKLNVDWYDELPSELKQRWEEWKKTLQDLPSMEIPSGTILILQMNKASSYMSLQMLQTMHLEQ